MNSSFPNSWSFSYLEFKKYVTNIIAEPKYKYGQQEQVTVRNHNLWLTKTMCGWRQFAFYIFITSQSATWNLYVAQRLTDERSFWHDVNVFPIQPIGNVTVWKFVINHVANLVRAKERLMMSHEIFTSVGVRCKIVLRKTLQKCRISFLYHVRIETNFLWRDLSLIKAWCRPADANINSLRLPKIYFLTGRK